MSEEKKTEKISLTDDELGQVSGGAKPRDYETTFYNMECTNCGARYYWRESHTGEIWDCDNCKQHTLLGL